MRRQLIYKKFNYLFIIWAVLLWGGQSFAEVEVNLEWKYKTNNPVVNGPPALGSDGTIYCGDGIVWTGSGNDSLYALNPDGTLDWRYEIGNAVGASTIGADGTIYFGSFDGYLYALNPGGTLKWKYQTKSWVFQPPALGSDGTVYFGSDDDYLYAMNSNGTLKWKYKTGDDAGAPTIGPDGIIYFGSEDNYLYALYSDMTLKWKFKTDGWVHGAPAIGPAGTVYFCSFDDYFYALDSHGKQKWKYKANNCNGNSPIIGPGGIIYFGSHDVYLYALNSTGTLEWKYDTGAYVDTTPAIGSDGTIYCGSASSYLYALNTDGSLKWKYKADASVTSPVVNSGGTIYFGSSYINAINVVNVFYDYYLPVFKPKPDYWSGLGITNLNSTKSANISVTVYDQSGIVLSTELKVLPANGQGTLLVGVNLTSEGWIKIISDEPLAGLNFLGEYEGTTSNYYLADVPFIETLAKLLLIPHVAQNTIWDTTIYIANPNASPAIVTLTYINKSGTASTPYIVTIPINGSEEIPVSTIGSSTSIKGGYVTISSTLDITAFALYNNLKTNNYSYAGINAVDNSVIMESYAYYLPVFKPKPDYWSGLGITNLNSAKSTNISVTVYNQSGTVMATESKTLSAKGQDAFLVGTQLSSDGWIKVTSNEPLAGLNFLGEYEGTTSDYYLADVPFTHTLSQSLLIPHVAQNTTWDTTIYIANPNLSTVSVTLTYTNKSGTASIPYVVAIPANGSKEITVDIIGNSDSIKGGYVTISSTMDVTAFALYNNLKTNNYSYAGINAVNLSQPAEK